MRTVTAASVAANGTCTEGLPESVLEALGELAGAAKEGLLALSVGVGLGVLHELLEAEVDEVVGPKGKQIPARTAVRHGHEGGEVTLGGRRVPVNRPRARTADGEHEVQLASYAHFAARDRLTDVGTPPTPTAGQLAVDLESLAAQVADDAEQPLVWHDLEHVVGLLRRIAALDLPPGATFA